jgi:osmotically inducible protein OsmC
MATEKTARATWEGTLAEGSGRFSLGSGAVTDQAVTWKDRAEEGVGTSPEELIAAAHASCVLMALAAGLAKAGTPPTKLESEARTTFDKVGEGFGITKIELSIRGQVDGIDDEAFQQAAAGAKENCPVSQALKGNVEVILDAALA